jgi:hypothetical protein
MTPDDRDSAAARTTEFTMNTTLIRPARYIVAALFAIACDQAPTGTSPLDDASAVSLDAAAAKAASTGDVASAALFTSGASALRAGLQPSEILVSVGGEVTRYRAIVIGKVESLSPGDTALRRSLIAWAGDDRTIATLDVSTLGDVGSFASEFEPASDPRSRAKGTWIDLVRDSRWIATTGTAGLRVADIGSECDGARFGDMRCVMATYDVFVDGLFRLHGASPDAGAPAVRIQTDARVAGVIIAEGGSRDPRRREAEPTRTQTETRGRGR